MLWWWDPTYIIVVPALLFSLWAQFKVKSSFKKYSQYQTLNGKTAAQIAQEILTRYGLSYIKVEPVAGNLTDHYDPRKKVLRLSEKVFNSSSIAAIGIAAHEAGHAIQHSQKYSPLSLRNSLVPAVNLTSWAAFPLFFIGFLFQSSFMIHLGIFFFLGVVIFQLITLPVELDASNRALKILSSGYLNSQEYYGAKKVLNAAALTYVAAAAVSLLELVRLLLISGILGGRRND